MNQTYSRIFRALFSKKDIERLEDELVKTTQSILDNYSPAVQFGNPPTPAKLQELSDDMSEFIELKTPSFNSCLDELNVFQELADENKIIISEQNPIIEYSDCLGIDGVYDILDNKIKVPKRPLEYMVHILGHEHTHRRESPFQILSQIEITKKFDEFEHDYKLKLLEVLEEGYANQNSIYAAENFNGYKESIQMVPAIINNFKALSLVEEELGKLHGYEINNWKELREKLVINNRTNEQPSLHDIGYSYFIINKLESEENYHETVKRLVLLND